MTKQIMKILARIPYSKGKAIDYYDDRIVFENKAIYYEDITGYGYALSSYSHSINFIPTYNSKTVSLVLSLGNDRKPVIFSKKVAMPSALHSKLQSDLDIIFSEVIEITDKLLSPMIVQKLYDEVINGEAIRIGNLIVEKDSIRRKGFFGEKELEEYGTTVLRAGQVIVEDHHGRQFFSTPLLTVNAPLLPTLLNTLFKD